VLNNRRFVVGTGYRLEVIRWRGGDRRKEKGKKQELEIGREWNGRTGAYRGRYPAEAGGSRQNG